MSFQPHFETYTQPPHHWVFKPWLYIWVMKLFKVYVSYDNYDDFQHVNFIFSQNFISLLWGWFNDESGFRVRSLFTDKVLSTLLVHFVFLCVQKALIHYLCTLCLLCVQKALIRNNHPAKDLVTCLQTTYDNNKHGLNPAYRLKP
jgi:hypothetical protein